MPLRSEKPSTIQQKPKQKAEGRSAEYVPSIAGDESPTPRTKKLGVEVEAQQPKRSLGDIFNDPSSMSKSRPQTADSWGSWDEIISKEGESRISSPAHIPPPNQVSETKQNVENTAAPLQRTTKTADASDSSDWDYDEEEDGKQTSKPTSVPAKITGKSGKLTAEPANRPSNDSAAPGAGWLSVLQDSPQANRNLADEPQKDTLPTDSSTPEQRQASEHTIEQAASTTMPQQLPLVQPAVNPVPQLPETDSEAVNDSDQEITEKAVSKQRRRGKSQSLRKEKPKGKGKSAFISIFKGKDKPRTQPSSLESQQQLGIYDSQERASASSPRLTSAQVSDEAVTKPVMPSFQSSQYAPDKDKEKVQQSLPHATPFPSQTQVDVQHKTSSGHPQPGLRAQETSTREYQTSPMTGFSFSGANGRPPSSSNTRQSSSSTVKTLPSVQEDVYAGQATNIDREHLKASHLRVESARGSDGQFHQDIEDAFRQWSLPDAQGTCGNFVHAHGSMPLEFKSAESGTFQARTWRDTSAIDLFGDRVETRSRRTFAGTFAGLRTLIDVVLALFFELLTFLLYVCRKLVVETLGLVADILVKPFLHALFNGFLHPVFVLLVNLASNISTVLAIIFGWFDPLVQQLERLLRAFRLVEIHQASSSKANMEELHV
eukprot:m.138641 g.138641  ORF g.138641 m.138641 type:complete len:658 (-) comp15919_c0_seq2:2760-4733(-)